MKPLHILFNAWADRNSVNAQNLNARDIAVRLDPMKFVVSMFCQKEPDPRLVERSNIHLIRIRKRLGSLTILHHMLSHYDAIFYLRFGRADSAYRWLRGKGFGTKPIITPIESPVNVLDNYPQYIRRYYDEAFRISDLAVANSEYVHKTVRDRYGIKIPIVYSGVDVEFFRNLASESVHREGPLRVMFAGSFQERKHPELVLDGAGRWPGVEFVVMGDGPLKSLLTQRITAERLTNVSLISTKEYSEYAKLLATSDIFFFPSRVEGLGKVLLEAAACGIPALVFDDYRTPAVVDGLTGFQVKTFEEMMSRLQQVIEERDLRLKMGRTAKEHVRKFDWEVIVKQWEDVFEKTIKRKK
jgi:glycosyltransferase involved in cell wall biosynthesis